MADFKHRLCVMVENAANNHNTEQETRAWKALLAADSLLFSDVRSQDGLSRRKLVADRLVTAEEGNWGALWAHCEQDSQQDLPQTASEAEKPPKLSPNSWRQGSTPEQLPQSGEEAHEPQPEQWRRSSWRHSTPRSPRHHTSTRHRGRKTCEHAS